jgi:hypothetical protein
MISKELLSEVLNLNITYIERCNNSIIYKISVYDREEEVNIYELAHKCKEWAKTKKMYINSIYNEFYWDRIEKEYFADIPNKNKSFYENTEVEAIFKACEWILKEIKDK